MLAKPGHDRCQLRFEGCTGESKQADHIVEVADGGPEFDVANGQGVCPNCHSIKTGRHARATQLGRGRRRQRRPHPSDQATRRAATR